MREQPLGFLHFFSSRRLHEVCMKTWPSLGEELTIHILRFPFFPRKLPDSKTALFVLWRTDLVRPFSQFLIQKLKLKRSRRIFFQYTSLLGQLDLAPIPFGFKWNNLCQTILGKIEDKGFDSFHDHWHRSLTRGSLCWVRCSLGT